VLRKPETVKIFVTGPDGLLGSNLVRELLSRGHEVQVLVQAGRHVSTLDGLDIQKVEGDLLNYDSLLKAAQGAEAIYHLAASTSIWPSRDPFVRKVNVEGTVNMLKVAKALNVKRFIHCGTANTFSFGDRENPGVEDTPYTGAHYGLTYMDSKMEAHHKVMEAVKEGLPALVVNPTFMIGPYDSTPSTGAMIMGVASGKVKGYAPGGRNFIYVKDAAIGMANALEKGRIGESYIIGHENLNYKEAFTRFAKVFDIPPPQRAAPGWLLKTVGFVLQTVGKITGKKPLLTYPMAKISCDEHFFTAAKAVKELDLPQTPIEIGVKESIDWLTENGYFKK
jgi:dihydroflavonol-4-reductase